MPRPVTWTAPAGTAQQEWSGIAPLGFGFFVIFLFLLFGRLNDFVLTRYHLPLFFSGCSLVAALFSGNFLMPIRTRIGASLLLYSAWLVMAAPFSVWRGGSYEIVVDEWSRSLAVFFVISALTVTTNQVMKVIRTISYSMVVAAFLALRFGVTTGGRLALPQGAYESPNELAAAMMLGCINTWFIISTPAHSKIRKLAGLLSILPLFYVMMGTGSRAVLVALACVCLFLLKQYTISQKLLLLPFILLAVVISTARLPEHVLHRYFTFFDDQINTATSEEDMRQRISAIGSSNQRMYMLKTSLRLTLEHPLFGVGPGMFAVAEDSMAHLEGRRSGTWKGTHNTYTEISSENGIPPLLFYVFCMLSCRKELAAVQKLCARYPQTTQVKGIAVIALTLKMTLLSYAVFYMFEHIAYSAFFPALAGLILAFGRAARRELAAPGSSGGVIRAAV
jgi:O-antigen ligase